MHKVEIKSKDGRTHLILDGMDISGQCYSFTISQDGPNGPELTLTLGCGELNIDAEVEKVLASEARDKSAPTLADALL